MVVVVLVIILALALTPAFRKLIIKSKYTEGASAIGALNTMIKVYYSDKSVTPGCGTNSTSIHVGNICQVLVDEATQGNTIRSATGAIDATDTDKGPFQQDLELDYTEFSSRYFGMQNYQFLCVESGYGNSDFCYALAAVGDGQPGHPPLGTGYGVLVRSIPTPNAGLAKFITAVYECYDPSEGASSLMYLDAVTTKPAPPSAVIPVPTAATYDTIPDSTLDSWGWEMN